MELLVHKHQSHSIHHNQFTVRRCAAAQRQSLHKMRNLKKIAHNFTKNSPLFGFWYHFIIKLIRKCLFLNFSGHNAFWSMLLL